MISVLHGGITTADWLRQLPHRTASLEEAGRVHGPSASLRPQALPSALPAAADGRCLPLMVTVWLQEHQPTCPHTPSNRRNGGAKDLGFPSQVSFSHREKLPSLQASLAWIGSTVQLQDLGKEVSIISSLYCREKKMLP